MTFYQNDILTDYPFILVEQCPSEHWCGRSLCGFFL